MKKEKMFSSSKNRYITQGALMLIPLEYQTMMWTYIEDLGKEIGLDYLQVFDFHFDDSDEKNKIQKVIHRQEVPEYEKEYIVDMKDNEGICAIVFVIDDSAHCTMLLASEY